ncbi:MAG: membrane lipoprotein lipid attachment site-containing protein [Tannerellaceae bacterium]|jgi:hypothetical protein|nr:membrane lipoprotein lipid attachment site-containing protein [Tannerellaceae bacterium]
MKRILVVFLAMIALSACEGPMGPAGRDGRDGTDGRDGQDGTKWYTASFTVNKSDWKLSGRAGDLNTYFYADKSIPELTDFVFDEGLVVGYIQTGTDVRNGMPFVLHQGEAVDGAEFLWTETYDFDYSPGMLRFYLTYSDFNTQVLPESETFHIVLMWE